MVTSTWKPWRNLCRTTSWINQTTLSTNDGTTNKTMWVCYVNQHKAKSYLVVKRESTLNSKRSKMKKKKTWSRRFRCRSASWTTGMVTVQLWGIMGWTLIYIIKGSNIAIHWRWVVKLIVLSRGNLTNWPVLSNQDKDSTRLSDYDLLEFYDRIINIILFIYSLSVPQHCSWREYQSRY